MKKPVKHKPVTKAKVHRKPVRVTPKIAAARHAAALKAAKTRAANAKKAKKRTLALGEGVACCSAEALAASLRLAGAAVSDDDVLALHWLAGGGVDTGVSILATLEAAQEFGLAGAQPRWAPVTEPFCTCGLVGTGHPSLGAHEAIGCAAEEAHSVAARQDALHAPLAGPVGAQFGLTSAHGLILGVELPGPHAVLAEPDRWWSWGEPYDPASWPDAIIEEAWTIEWG